MGHTAFEMLLVPLVFWVTFIYLSMAAVHVLFSAMARLSRRPPGTDRPAEARPLPVGRPGPRTAPRRLAPISLAQPS